VKASGIDAERKLVVGRVLYWSTVIPLFLVVIVFSVTNRGMVELNLWPVLTQAVSFPVYGIALVGLFIGFVLGGIVSWVQNGRTRRRIRDLQNQSEADQREIATLRERLSRLEATEREATIPPAPPVPVEPVARE
jgi:uncharacterized integral membrane protein